MIVKLSVCPNDAYSAAQIAERKNILTVGELRDLLEGYEDDTQIVTYDELNHGRGACWGYVADVEESVEDEDEDE